MSTETERTQLIADLKGAKQEIVNRGRGTGHLLGLQGKVCIVGAALAAIEPEMLTINAAAWHAVKVPRVAGVVNALHDHLPSEYVGAEARYRTPEYQLAHFNDDRRKPDGDEDVLNLFDKALAEAGGLG